MTPVRPDGEAAVPAAELRPADLSREEKARRWREVWGIIFPLLREEEAGRHVASGNGTEANRWD